MGDALDAIQKKMEGLNGLMEVFNSQPQSGSELTGPEGVEKLQEYFQQAEGEAKSLVEIFVDDNTKTEAPSWAQQDKDDMAKGGLELFNKLEALDSIIAPQGDELGQAEAEAAPFAAAGTAAAASVMQVLCVVRAFTQLVNFYLIDATFAIVYIIRDKIQNVIHLDKNTYNEVKDAWRLRCG